MSARQAASRSQVALNEIQPSEDQGRPGARPRVVIVGAGFGGLNAAKALAGKPLDVLLVDRYNYHLFQPLLYQVATAGLGPEEIAYPVRRIIHRLPNVDFHMADIQAIDLAQRQLLSDMGPIRYDYLILAAGSENNFFGLEQLAQNARGLKDLQEADALRNHLLTCFEQAVSLPRGLEREELLTFVVCGGGPTGVEFAGALAELIVVMREHDFRGAISAGEIRLILVEHGPDLVSMLHPRLRRAALRELQNRDVDVRLRQKIEDFDGRTVRLDGGSTIAARTLMWAAGVQASRLSETLGMERGRGGRLPVTPALHVEAHPEVYVIGDMAYLLQNGQPLAQLAPVAIQEAQTAAENILRHMRGVQARRFRYRDKGTLAVIGRRSAVAQFGPVCLHGLLAWLMWLAVHIAMLIGFRNRLVVLIDWATSYFSYERALRLITRR